MARLEPEPEVDAVFWAAQHAGAGEMILELPGGYDFQVAAGGAALSDGQRQRIAMERALCGDPVVVLLDKPDARLDAAGVEALSPAIAPLKVRGGSAPIVRNRPEASAACNEVNVIEQGQMLPVGPQDETTKPAAPPQPDGGETDR